MDLWSALRLCHDWEPSVKDSDKERKKPEIQHVVGQREEATPKQTGCGPVSPPTQVGVALNSRPRHGAGFSKARERNY